MKEDEVICEVLKAAGISDDEIRKEYPVYLGKNKYIADIAIVGKTGVVRAVFEIKCFKDTKRSKCIKELLQIFGRLFVAFKPSVHFYVVCDNEVAEVVADKDGLKWCELRNYVSELKAGLRDENPYTISEYLEKIREAKSKLTAASGERNAKFFYRGQNFKLSAEDIKEGKKELVPSLFRPLKSMQSLEKLKAMPTIVTKRQQTYFNEEPYLIQEAMRLFPSAFSECNTVIDEMTVAQHYGIPTRLLDVTGNALVALYFAVQGDIENDGVVYVFSASIADFRLASLRGQSRDITIEEYHKGQHKKGMSKLCPNHPFLIFPTFRTQRQAAQDGAFYFFGNEIKTGKMHEFTSNEYECIEIPRGSKQNLLRQLKDECNIHLGTLFPESLDGSKDKLVAESEKRILDDIFNKVASAISKRCEPNET